MNKKKILLVRALLILSMLAIGYFLSDDTNLLGKIGVLVAKRILASTFLKVGFSGTLAIAIAAIGLLATEPQINSVGTEERNGVMRNIFGPTTTSQSSQASNTSEESVNQLPRVPQAAPQPPMPAPVPPAAHQPQWIPEDPHGQYMMMGAQKRIKKLAHRWAINSLQMPPEEKERLWGKIMAAQIDIEERIENALVNECLFSRERIFEKRHEIRGFLFYPNGTTLTENTYKQHLMSMYRNGTQNSVPFRRLMRAIEDHHLTI